MNKRITNKERGLLKGAIRRVFSRSDLRKEALDAVTIEHTDTSRPRVKKWAVCPECKQYTPKYLMQVDHQEPIVPIDSSLEEMSWDEVVNRVWCERFNLRALCKPCHNVKTKDENKQRRRLKKERKSK